MKFTSKPTIILAGLVALLSGCSGESAPPVIAVAGGQAYLDVVRMVVAEAEEAGNLPPIDTLLITETSNRAAPALDVARRIVETPGVVAVVGHANSAASLVTAQIYNSAGVVHIAPTTTAATYSEAGPWSFRMVPSDIHQGPYLADRIRRSHPPGTRVALFYVNDDYGRGLRTSVRAALDSAEYPVVVEAPHLEGGVAEEDVSRGVAALEAADADVVLWLARPEALELFLPAIRDVAPRLPIYSGDAVARATALDQPRSFWAGVAFTDFVDRSVPEVQAFLDRLEVRSGRGGSGGEVLMRDAFLLVLEAVRSGATTSAEVRAYLESLGDSRPPFEGLAGAVAFDSAGDLRRATYVMDWLAPLR